MLADNVRLLLGSKVVTLKRGAQGFGVAFFSPGTADTPMGVFVSHMAKAGSAAINGRIALGDHVVEVNGTDVRKASAADVTALVAQSLDHVELSLVRNEELLVHFRKQLREHGSSIRRTEDRRKRKSRRQLQQATKVCLHACTL